MASCSLNLNLVLIFLLIFSSLWTCPGASSRDTLKPGDTLNSSSSLVSANGQFTLAFKVSDDNSNSSYLVIKWAGINNYAWVANPNTPILYPLGILTLDTNHTLKITHKGGDPITLFSAPETNNIAVVATLLDSGNFVQQQINSDDGSTKRILWQSFDYPGDILLPGMKLGVNHRNSHIWSLSSWFTPISAAPGAFTLDWDPIEHQLKIRRHGVVYWSSGAFESGRFKFVDLADDSKYNFSVVSNENEDYFTYTSVEKSEWLLSISGRLFEFGSNHDIARADNCYGHNTDGGCQRYSEDQPIGCRHLIGGRFEQEKGYFNPTNHTSSNVKSTTTSDSNTSLGLSDCKAACWRNCDCFGFNSLLDNQTGCKFWIGNWEFVQDRSGYSSASPYFLAKSSSKARSTKKWIWIGTGIAAALLLCIVCLLLIRRRNFILSGQNGTKIQEVLNLMEYNRPIDVNGLQNEGMGHHHLSVFSYASVMAATSNFSMENKLGEGGFGTVYKGKLVTGQEIAVKRLSECSGQGTLEFKNELILIYELQHTNLVRLFGFCIHNEERMLIYEYMPNRSLEHFIFDPTKGQLLDWKKRFSIIEGIAQGLLYLHKYSRMTVIHRDLKASNILLDESMNPKISDFGMARIFTRNEQLEASTDRVVGTYGYMSPEYMMGFFSIKSDVYSFGVLMLEIISGRKNNSFNTAHRMHHLVGHAWELWKEGAWLELIDPTVGDSCIPDQLLRCIHVGLLCVEENAADRPTMSDVISMLTNESMALPIPIKPAFCTERNVVTTDVGGMATKSRSLNDSMSFSNFGGR